MKNLFASLFLVSYLLSLASSFSNLPMGTNASAPKLQKRQFPTIHCGDKVKLKYARSLKTRTARTCTLGFAVKRGVPKGARTGRIDQGYLTLGGCISAAPIKVKGGGGNPYDVIYSYQDQDLVIGKTYNNLVNQRYEPAEGLD